MTYAACGHGATLEYSTHAETAAAINEYYNGYECVGGARASVAAVSVAKKTQIATRTVAL